MDPEHRSTRISLTYHCLKRASVGVSVIVPMAYFTPEGGAHGPQQLADVRFSFLKICDPEATQRSGHGTPYCLLACC